MLITLEPTFALQLKPYTLIEDTCRIILVPNTMLSAILKFNYNVNYVKCKKHTSILRGKIDVTHITMFLERRGSCLRTEGSFLNVPMAWTAKQYIFMMQIKRSLIKDIVLIITKCS